MKRKITTKLKKSAALICAVTLLLGALYNDMLTSAAEELQDTSVTSEEGSSEQGEASEESADTEESGVTEESEVTEETTEEITEATEETGETTEATEEAGETTEATEETGETTEATEETGEITEATEETEETTEPTEETEASAEQISPDAIGVNMPSENDTYYVEESGTVTLEAPKDGEDEIAGSFSVTVEDENGDSSAVELNDDGTSFNLPVNNAGSYTLVITFTPDDTEAYIGTNKTLDYTVSKIPVEINWLDESWETVYDGDTSVTISLENAIAEAVIDLEEETNLEAPTISITEATFTLSDANAGTEAKEATLVTGDNYTFFGIEANKYELSVPAAEIIVKPISLSYTVTVADKMFDLTNAVEEGAVSWSCDNDEAILEADKDKFSLNLTEADIVYENIGSLNEDTEVEIVFAENYEAKLVDSDGNEYSNYEVLKDNITLNASNIKANEAVELSYGATTNDFAEFTWTYDDEESSVYWINGSDKLIITPKAGCEIATEWNNADTVFGEETSVVSDENKQIVFYAKNAEGHVYQITLNDVGTDTTAPTVEHEIKKSLLLQNKAVVYTITVTDEESGVASLAYQVVTDSNELADDGWNTSASSNEITVAVPAYGYLYIKAVDNVGNENVSDAIHPLVLEEEKPVLSVKIDGDAVASGDTVNKYLMAHTFDVTATDYGANKSEDEFAGVAKIEWKLMLPNSTDVVCEGSYEADGEPKELSELSNFKTLTGETKTLSIGDEEEKLDSDKPYTLVLQATDFAGNKSAEFTVGLKFDNTAPVGSVSVAAGTTREPEEVDENTEVITDYYNKAFTVNVTVFEQLSFSEGEFTFSVLKDGEVHDQVNDIEKFSYDENSGEATLSYEISSEKDGEGTYTFKLEGKDGAGNELVYEGPEYKVILDITTPKITKVSYVETETENAAEFLSYTEKDAAAAKYYINKKVTLNFEVDELYLPASSDVELISNADLKEIDWTIDQNIAKGSIPVTQYGEFGDEQTVVLTVVDKAGNTAELIAEKPAHVVFDDKEGKFTDTFTIDMVEPKIIAVEYKDEEGRDISFLSADDNKDYINTNVTIVFTIDEHNLTENSIGSITADGGEVTDPEWDKELNVEWFEENGTKTGSYTVEQRGEFGDQQISKLVIVDRAGNEVILAEGVTLRSEQHTKLENGTFEEAFTVDKVAPKITAIAYTDAEGNAITFLRAEDGKDYINKNVTITFTVDEHNIPDKTIGRTTETGGEIDANNQYDKKQEVEWAKENDINTGFFTVEQRGEKGDLQTSKLVIVDRAGNREETLASNLMRCTDNTTFVDGEFTDAFVVDTVAPEVTLSYENMSRSTYVEEKVKAADGVTEETVTVDYFGMANVENPELQLKVSVNEHNFQASNVSITKEWTGKEVTFDIDETWTQNDDTNTKMYTMKGDSLYIYKIVGTDKAGNQIVLITTDGISSTQEGTEESSLITLRAAIDTQIPAVGDTLKPVVNITNPENPVGKDICGDTHPLYNTNVTYRAEIYDPLNNDYASGIEEIVITASGASGVKQRAVIDKAGEITYYSVAGEGDNEVLTALADGAEDITVALKSNNRNSLAKGKDNAYQYDITLNGAGTFNTNDIKLTIEVTDVSTNALTNVETSLISIDTTAPEVRVSYDNNDVRNDMYFNANRTATITVTERNWSPDCIDVDVTGGSVSAWRKVEGTEANGDDTKWIGYVDFTQEGPCSLGVSTSDRASNTQRSATQYSGAAPHNFIIDKTAPVLSYVFDNNNVQNEKYYMAGRNLTVTVNDAYFAGQNDIIILSNGQAVGMVFNGMVATYAFVSDGVYSFQGTVTDLAGNVSAPIIGSEFVIDLTAPVVEFAGIEDQKAYGPDDTFEPDVDFTDTNFYEGGVTFTLVRENWDGQDAPINGNYAALMYVLGQSSSAPNGRDDLYQLTDTSEEIDGLYTLTVYVYDQAGNRNNGEEGDTIQFSINRYGSVYILDETTRAELNGYYIAKVPNIVIHEYNLSNALESWIDIITSAGERVRLVKGTDYTVSSEGAAEGCDWRMRTYTILAENFTTDGEYTVEIYVKDDVNNVSTNNDPKAENRGVSVNFVRDTEDPNVTLGGPANGGIYQGNSMALTVEYGDNIQMSMLIVIVSDEAGNVLETKTYAVPTIVDGKRVLPEGADEELEIYSGKFEYMLTERAFKQIVTVTAIDAAGNSTSVENSEGTDHVIPAISFTLSTSKIVLWYNNKPVFYGTIGGALGTVALAMIILLIIKKRKKDKEETES